ncbi:MAG: ATP-binding protein [Gammaproteobacteria bacterium]|nr:ATP-binding protein [Gammaproteobacteria bacterium]
MADEQRIRSRVVATKARQLDRQGCLNVSLMGRAPASACRLDHAAHRVLLSSRVSAEGSLRSQDRLIRVARTIADLLESPPISEADVPEAVALRQTLS